MSLGKHLDEAASRLEDAHRRIKKVREQQPTNENLRAWLVALTDYAEATHDVQRFCDEGVNERIQELAAKVSPARR
ncbi:MAG: hypothetical protein Q8L48_30680 [Archangium sp.]|nr:hypothetical protein [Archangium sp.]